MWEGGLPLNICHSLAVLGQVASVYGGELAFCRWRRTFTERNEIWRETFFAASEDFRGFSQLASASTVLEVARNKEADLKKVTKTRPLPFCKN